MSWVRRGTSPEGPLVWEEACQIWLPHSTASAEVQARTFAPLMLTWVVDAGDREAFEAVARWYPAESDTRGYDDDFGWLHAVAHGADYLGECARTGIATGREVLDLLAARLIGPRRGGTTPTPPARACMSPSPSSRWTVRALP